MFILQIFYKTFCVFYPNNDFIEFFAKQKDFGFESILFNQTFVTSIVWK